MTFHFESFLIKRNSFSLSSGFCLRLFFKLGSENFNIITKIFHKSFGKIKNLILENMIKVLSTRKGTVLASFKMFSDLAETFRIARYICGEWIGSKKKFFFSKKISVGPPPPRGPYIRENHKNSSRMAKNDQFLASRVPK